MRLRINNVRAAFLNVFEPQSVNGGAPSFGGSFLVDPKDKQVKDIEAAMLEVAEAKWGDKGEAILAKLKKTGKVCFRDGDDKSEYDGFEDMMYVSASNKSKPLIVDKDRTELSQADGRPYSGCYVNATVEIWAQDNTYGKRVNASLKGVQFYKDGDSFSGGTPGSVDDFDDLGDLGDDEDDLA